MSVVYNLGKSIFTVYFMISGEWVPAIFAKIIAARASPATRCTMGERNSLAHVHIVEFIFIAEIATIHSRPVIYSGERSSAPRPPRTKKDLGEERERERSNRPQHQR